MTPLCSQADNWSGYFWQDKRHEQRVSILIKILLIKRELVHFMFVLDIWIRVPPVEVTFFCHGIRVRILEVIVSWLL